MIWAVFTAKTKIILFILVLLIAFVVVLTKIFEVFSCNSSTLQQIDVVYTWVNGSDTKFLLELQRYSRVNLSGDRDVSEQRFSDKYELKFSLRSLEKFAPWVRHVFIVTNGQIPYWLNLDYEKVTVVHHKEIFPNSYDLPTFSSPAIESHLHRIPGLSERFIYFNDDVFLGTETYIDDFYSNSKGFLIYMAWSLPMCATDCPWLYVSDGECDVSCYNKDCQMDGGDCDKKRTNQIPSVLTLDSEEIIETDYGENFLQNLITTNKPINLTNLITKHNQRVILLNKRRKKFTNSTLINRINDNMNMKNNFDAYGASLQHTNRIFNERYGFMVRQVPAHAPIMIDKNIMNNLQIDFHKEFEITSRNRFRHANDMQFSFSYYYYLIQQQRNLSILEIFDRFDTDSSLTWSDREIRTLLTQLYELPLTYQIVEHFESLLINCTKKDFHQQISTPEFERYIDSNLPTITKETITNCPILTKILEKRFGKESQYKYHIIKNSENNYVTFKMLNSNVSDVVSHLDEIRQNTKKFICLNDNLNDAKLSDNELVKAVLYDFYLSLFPKPSKFELRADLRNRFLYIEDLEQWQEEHFKIKMCMYFFVVLLCYITFINVCKARYVCRIFNKITK